MTPITDLSQPAVWYSYAYSDLIDSGQRVPYGNHHNDTLRVDRILGYRNYEITDHLGNVLASVLDRKTGVDTGTSSTHYAYYNPDMSSVQRYFPGGMVQNRKTVGDSVTRFGYNGQMRDDDIAGAYKHNTALHWEYNPLNMMRWNRDPKPNVSVSPYATFMGNPMWHSDPFGDSVKVSGLYKKNADGEYVNERWIRAFEAYASTTEGRTYLLDHAQKGFELQGVFYKGLNIVATEEGSSSKRGVDVSFEYGEVDGSAGAHTSSKIVGGAKLGVHNESSYRGGGRLKTTYVFPTTYRPVKYFRGGFEGEIYGVNRIIHEVFLHGLLHEERYFDDQISTFLGGKDHNSSHFPKSYYAEHGIEMLNDAIDIHKINSGEVHSISQKRLMMMIHWGRGWPGWFYIINGREANNGEQVNFNEAVKKLKSTE